MQELRRLAAISRTPRRPVPRAMLVVPRRPIRDCRRPRPPSLHHERAVIEAYELNSLADLASLRTAWRELLASTPNYSFFQTLEWLEAAWDNYAHEQRLRVVVVER